LVEAELHVKTSEARQAEVDPKWRWHRSGEKTLRLQILKSRKQLRQIHEKSLEIARQMRRVGPGFGDDESGVEFPEIPGWDFEKFEAATSCQGHSESEEEERLAAVRTATID
jgi:hypothetical protein